MNVVEFIRDKTQRLQKNNAEFCARINPQFKNLSNLLNKTISNTLNNPWILKIKPFTEDPCTSELPIPLIPAAVDLYKTLENQLEQENYIGEWFCVDQDCINQFADVTGDNQWIHTDPVRAAKESPFKSTIAHGFLTLALLPKLTESVDSEKAAYPEAKMVVNYGLNQVRFPSPVKAGSRVRARRKLIDVTAMKRSIELVHETSIEVENGKRYACVAETVLRLYF